MRRASFIAVLAAIAAGWMSASAQTLRAPVLYLNVAGQPSVSPPCSSAADPPTVVNMLWVNVYDDASYPGGFDSPVDAARSAANQVISRLYPTDGTPPTLSPGTICVFLYGFGHDSHRDQQEDHAWPQPANWSRTRFFQPSDRLEVLSPGLPIWDQAFPMNNEQTSFGTNRTYRHPFLYNSTATLRAWFQQFVQEWQAIQTPGHFMYNASRPLLNPVRFYLDAEPLIAAPGDQNSVFMLRFLADQWGIWAGWPVPGFNGATLRDLYDVVKGPYGWPDQITDPVRGLDPSLSAQDARIRGFMNWYYQICQAAKDNVMREAVYDVLRTQWGWAGIESGNYGDARTDGTDDSTGWFIGRPDPANPGILTVTDRYPRCWIEPTLGGWMFPDAQGHLRWLGLPQRATGELDCPFLYKLDDDQWAGTNWHEAQRQPNLYLPGAPLEADRSVTSLRLYRHHLESIANSFGGGHEGRLAPWMQMAWPSLYGELPPSDSRFIPRDDLAQILALCRSKNVRELALWADPDPQIAAAMQASADIARAVYAPRIDYYQRAVGTIPGQQPGAYDPAYDPSRLEFTLRLGGWDSTVDIQADTWYTPVTELEVTFSGLACYGPGTSLLINVEGSTTDPSTTGMLLAWDYAQQRWAAIPTAESTYSYAFFTPDHSSRRTHVLRESGGFQRYIRPDGTLLLKLVQSSPFGGFISSYDLVQVIPVQWPSPIVNSVPLPISLLPGDMNYDWSVTPADLSEFIALWMQGNHAADINRDGLVDPADVAAFVRSFLGQ